MRTDGARTSVSMEEWQVIQIHELATWTHQAYPDLHGKRIRELGYQRQVLNQFRISGLAGVVADVGCGPLPILNQIEGNFVGIGIDPLIPEFAKVYPVLEWPRCLPLVCCAEDIRLPSNSVHQLISTNALDHFRDPRQALEEMVRILKPGGTLYLHFCIENASKGNPHPAHKIDLTPELVNGWLRGKLDFDCGRIVPYGWREQPAWVGVYRKP